MAPRSHSLNAGEVPVGGDIGLWLRESLSRRRISQRVLAQRSGVSHSTISRIITGHRRPGMATLTKLAAGVDDRNFSRLLTVGRSSPPQSLGLEGDLESALRGDPLLDDRGVDLLLHLYRTLRQPESDGDPA